MKCSVVIATYNRAGELPETLASLAGLETRFPWELIVVDNNSTDATATIVREAAAHFPVELRYLRETRQGRSAALNAGVAAARGAVIATTDDDVRVERDWLARAREGLERFGCDYVGGRVLPIWRAAPPAWLSTRGGRQWSVIALLNYGPEPIELGRRVPLGVNMAFRRDAFDRAGLWEARVGRTAGTLLGQEVREWCARAAAAGLHGYYLPEMVVHHVIPADRLTRRYFRRWYYWRGVSRAMLYGQAGLDIQAPQLGPADLTNVRHVGGVPRHLYRTCARELGAMAQAVIRREPVAAFDHELWLWFFAGVVRQRWRDRKQAPGTLLGRAQAPIGR